MDFSVEKTSLEGLLKLQCKVFNDARGSFVKNFRETHLKSLGLETHFPEEFVTTSVAGVLRGLHFQTPPHDHIKIVSCFAGEVLDVVLDLRKSSPTYGRHEAFSLREDAGLSLYIPKGFAHGFLSMKDGSVVHYQVSTEYAPTHDSGVLWNSAGIAWPVKDPVVSTRDQGLSRLADFKSPF
jgi:dTDP-4-dehydrorhamnose 3,5-epimerase